MLIKINQQSSAEVEKYLKALKRNYAKSFGDIVLDALVLSKDKLEEKYKAEKEALLP